MNGLSQIFSAKSTNGRWGLAVVGPEGTTLPAQGSLRHIGAVGGVETYIFSPGNTGTWAMSAGDVKVHGGATLVAHQYLQSDRYASLLLLGPQAVVEHYGYKRRGSRVLAYVNGQETDIPQTVLAALGLVKPVGEPDHIEPPPALEGAMAEALKRLRL